MPRRNYTSISITKDLAERIDSILGSGGYQNRADFVREAIRRLLNELERKE